MHHVAVLEITNAAAFACINMALDGFTVVLRETRSLRSAFKDAVAGVTRAVSARMPQITLGVIVLTISRYV